MKYFIIVQKIGKNMLELKNSIKKSFLCNYYCTGNKITSRRCMRNTCVMNQSYVSPTSKDNFIGYRREEDFIRNSGIIGFGFGVCCSLLQRRLLLPMDKVALFSRKNHEMPPWLIGFFDPSISKNPREGASFRKLQWVRPGERRRRAVFVYVLWLNCCFW